MVDTDQFIYGKSGMRLIEQSSHCLHLGYVAMSLVGVESLKLGFYGCNIVSQISLHYFGLI